MALDVNLFPKEFKAWENLTPYPQNKFYQLLLDLFPKGNPHITEVRYFEQMIKACWASLGYSDVKFEMAYFCETNIQFKIKTFSLRGNKVIYHLPSLVTLEDITNEQTLQHLSSTMGYPVSCPYEIGEPLNYQHWIVVWRQYRR